MANTNNGNFVWHDNLAKDPKESIAFYTEVLGWKTEKFDNQYVMWVGKQGPVGGVVPVSHEGSTAPPHWMGHVQVEDVDETATLAKELGAKMHKEPTDIPGVGRYAVFEDPQGVPISVFKPNEAMPAHDPSKEGEFCWNELMTSDSAAAFEFYSRLFGWKVIQDMDMGAKGTYRVFGLGDKSFGGMMDMPKEAGIPPTWIYYTETSDLEGAIERATKRGAKVMNGPMDVPGGGRVAQLTDPQGAPFALHSLGKKN